MRQTRRCSLFNGTGASLDIVEPFMRRMIHFRTDAGLRDRYARLMAPPSIVGYLNQLYAAAGWTSIFSAHRIIQPMLVMAGEDDPITRVENARLLNKLIPNAELKVLDCGHLFLLTRLTECTAVIENFLQQESSNGNQ